MKLDPEDMDALVERAAELFNDSRAGHTGAPLWADTDAQDRNYARGRVVQVARHVLAAAAELEPTS